MLTEKDIEWDVTRGFFIYDGLEKENQAVTVTTAVCEERYFQITCITDVLGQRSDVR